MKVSIACIELIKLSESFSARPYRCPAGVWTIGYGSTRYENGTPVASTDASISEARAVQIMLATLSGEYESAVNRYVTVPMEQHQFDALVDFAYNCGSQNLRISTLLKLLNRGDYVGAAAQFGLWVRAEGRVLQGLVTRREAERKLFLGA